MVTLAGHLGPESRLGGRRARERPFPDRAHGLACELASIGRDALALDLHETHAVVGAAGANLSIAEVDALR